MQAKGRTIPGVLGAIIVLLVSGCGPGGGPPPNPPVEVAVAKVTTDAVESRLTAVGTILANEDVTIKPEAAGKVRAIHFTEGQRVQAGALLFEFDDEKEQAQVEQARIDLKLAKQNAERADELSGTRAISEQELDQIRSQVTLKSAILAFQERRLAETRIEAPFDGVLGQRSVSLGQFVNIGEPLVTLTDDSLVKVVYEVPERHLAVLREGQPVALEVAAYADRVFQGKVQLVDPRVSESTRTLKVRAIADNPERLLRPGMFARVETITGVEEKAVVIEERAIIPSLAGFAVYVVTNDVARLTEIEVGQRLPGKAEVRQGLVPGQIIVVGGLQKIVDGSAVIPEASDAAPVSPDELSQTSAP